ncbi:hypothetical protein JAAARDRAFT_40199 [Jaapia argillacea MUCL 33604]|uniref:DUF6533 domain-containing protein n=1 Tax=Jaapia argillacea MUCL 33604 TaxID=933084 RepID=A0A067PQJ5_9AGAM|nr:hypothetical protein JAAARDRAFT_40199 [Jaapia argillacea MUCL 33604]
MPSTPLSDSIILVAAETVQYLGYSTISSIAFLLWDCCITLDQEVEFIWRQPRGSILKWAFLFARYFTFFILAAIIFQALSVLGHTHLPLSCKSWFVMESVSTQLLSISVEIILMLRVYGLYGQSRVIGGWLCALLGLEILTLIPVYVIAIPRLELSIACTPIPSNASKFFFLYVSCAAIFVQIVLLTFSLIKTVGSIRSGWGRTPVIYTFLRDGSWVFVVQFAAIILLAMHYFIPGSINGHIMFTWWWAFMSFSTCRLVLNLYQLGASMSHRSRDRRRRSGNSRSRTNSNGDSSGTRTGSSSNNFTTNVVPGFGYCDEDDTFEMTPSVSWDRTTRS